MYVGYSTLIRRRIHGGRKTLVNKLGWIFWVVNQEFLAYVEDVKVVPGYRSDYSIVVLQCKFTDFKRGRGLWKFNNALLKDANYSELVKSCISDVMEQHCENKLDMPIADLDQTATEKLKFSINDQLMLEAVLLEIRTRTLEYSGKKRRQMLKTELDLENEIADMENDDEISNEKRRKKEEKSYVCKNILLYHRCVRFYENKFELNS